MEEIGQVPVTINKEIDGFGLNRIQYAIINECWNLVEVFFLQVFMKSKNIKRFFLAIKLNKISNQFIYSLR